MGAAEGSLASMGLQVLPQISRQSKRFRTMGAAMWLLSSVQPEVTL
jgi:hypothetical protein